MYLSLSTMSPPQLSWLPSSETSQLTKGDQGKMAAVSTTLPSMSFRRRILEMKSSSTWHN